MDHTKIQDGVRLILDGMGVPDDDNFRETPRRFAKMLGEIFSPPETDIPVFDEKYTDMVIMRGHVFYTLCPHHLLPVEIRAALAYIPNGKVIGASKLMRIMHDVNRFPMTQEALTAGILKRITELTQGTSKGSIVLLEGEHGCFRVRGVRSHDASMVTLKSLGDFATPEMERKFLDLVKQ